MADRHFRSLFRALHLRREQWTFLLMALLCVSVIVGTALWTRQAEFARVTPTPPVSGDISAAQLLQQSLDSAQTSTPAPTTAPTIRSVTTPLESMTLLRPFDNTRMRQSSATGLWALHDAADYAGAEGAKVSAMADGTVINCADSGVFGAYAEIDHGGVLVRYANLSMLYAIRAGDPVRAGQTIGFIGRTMPEECDLPAHLHLRIVVGDTAVDPEKVLQNGVFLSRKKDAHGCCIFIEIGV